MKDYINGYDIHMPAQMGSSYYQLSLITYRCRCGYETSSYSSIPTRCSRCGCPITYNVSTKHLDIDMPIFDIKSTNQRNKVLTLIK